MQFPRKLETRNYEFKYNLVEGETTLGMKTCFYVSIQVQQTETTAQNDFDTQKFNLSW